jgi:pyruvate/2-oxoglutarate dehydrogenase complex dihydrolipoamide dehydrogenase (E3) component
MVSGYDDAGQAAWARGAGIEVVRGRGALAGRGTVVVEGTSYTAEHIVVATGSDRRSRRCPACGTCLGCGRTVRSPG